MTIDTDSQQNLSENQAPVATKTGVKSIYRFMAEVLVWLIISLIAWFALARILNIPLVWLTDYVLGWFTNGTITGVEMHNVYSSQTGLKFMNQQLIIITNIANLPSFHAVEGYNTVFAPTRPLLYGYGFPAFIALTLAIPKQIKSENRKWFEIFIAYIVFLFVQLLGVSSEAFMQLVFSSPTEISNHFPTISSHIDVLGTVYQMSTLLFPPAVPLILWMLFNTKYMELLVGRKLS